MQPNPDRLIEDLSADARRLLWVIALANDPVDLNLLSSIRGEQSHELIPLLRQLLSVGLATEERNQLQDDNPFLTCPELVRERVLAWMGDHEPDRGELTENSVRLAYAERLESTFHDLQHKNMSAAIEAGSRAIVYYVQSGGYDRLSYFASRVITTTNDPRLPKKLLPYIEAAAESAPEGWPRCCCLVSLADAWMQAGRPDVSLTYYEQSAAQARSAAESGDDDSQWHWSILGWITANWSLALHGVGDIDASRQRMVESVEAEKQAGSSAQDVIYRELHILRIDIGQDRVAEALPEVESRLARIEEWWKLHLSGQSVEEAPDPLLLARTLITALDIAREAHCAQEDWKAAMGRIEAGLEVQRIINSPAEDIAMYRINRAIVLDNLGYSEEAKSELEDCLQIFQDDPANKAIVFTSLAILFNKQGYVSEAIRQARSALALYEQLPNPSSRAESHNKLSIFLDFSGKPSLLSESSRHQLAALIYSLVSGPDQSIQTSLQLYIFLFSRANESGDALYVPRLAELLSDPAFRSLSEWLEQQQIDLTELQATVDQFIDQAREAALEQE